MKVKSGWFTFSLHLNHREIWDCLCITFCHRQQMLFITPKQHSKRFFLRIQENNLTLFTDKVTKYIIHVFPCCQTVESPEYDSGMQPCKGWVIANFTMTPNNSFLFLFFDLYVSNWLSQLGQIHLKFSLLLLEASPSIWSRTKTKGFPLCSCEQPHIAQTLFSSSIISFFFNVPPPWFEQRI